MLAVYFGSDLSVGLHGPTVVLMGASPFLSPPPPLQRFMKQLSYFTSCLLPTTALPRSANLACRYKNSSKRLHLAGEWPLCGWPCTLNTVFLKKKPDGGWVVAYTAARAFSLWQQKFPTSGVIGTQPWSQIGCPCNGSLVVCVQQGGTSTQT